MTLKAKGTIPPWVFLVATKYSEGPNNLLEVFTLTAVIFVFGPAYLIWADVISPAASLACSAVKIGTTLTSSPLISFT